MTEKKIKPLGPRVLVKRAQSPARKGGILLPDSAQEKPQIGEIVAMGAGHQEEDGTMRPLDVKIGDKVLFSAYSGTSVKGDDREDSDYLLMSEDDILALVHP